MCSEFNGASDLLVFMSLCHRQVEIWTLKDRPSENISTGKKNLCGTLSTAELKKKSQNLRPRRDIRHFNQEGVQISHRALSKKCLRGLN